MGTIKDRTGERYGKLTVVRCLGTKLMRYGKWRAQWLCVCDCGKEHVVSSESLQRSGRYTSSCGCSRFIPDQGAALNDLYATYKRSSRDRGIPFDLTKDELKQLAASPCRYCGRSPYAANRGRLLYSGIDRVDNARGYTPDNCVPCCKECNGAKSKMTVEQFINMCRLVAAHYKETSL